MKKRCTVSPAWLSRSLLGQGGSDLEEKTAAKFPHLPFQNISGPCEVSHCRGVTASLAWITFGRHSVEEVPLVFPACRPRGGHPWK